MKLIAGDSVPSGVHRDGPVYKKSSYWGKRKQKIIKMKHNFVRRKRLVPVSWVPIRDKTRRITKS
jgi:hypothetical protein